MMMNEQSNKNGPENDGLEYQLKLSNFFMHTELSRISSKINEIDAFLNGVADLLLKKHIIREDDLASSVAANKTEMIEKNTIFLPRIATRKDDPDATFTARKLPGKTAHLQSRLLQTAFCTHPGRSGSRPCKMEPGRALLHTPERKRLLCAQRWQRLLQHLRKQACCLQIL